MAEFRALPPFQRLEEISKELEKHPKRSPGLVSSKSQREMHDLMQREQASLARESEQAELKYRAFEAQYAGKNIFGKLSALQSRVEAYKKMPCNSLFALMGEMANLKLSREHNQYDVSNIIIRLLSIYVPLWDGNNTLAFRRTL